MNEAAVHPNIYEFNIEKEEIERLKNFEPPSKFSIELIESIINGNNKKQSLLDIGCGKNTDIYEHFIDSINYTGLDIRDIDNPHQYEIIKTDIRNPFADKVNHSDITHCRFVLAHFDENNRKNIINNCYESTTSGGISMFIDYNWEKLKGSKNINALRDFSIINIKTFDPRYGDYAPEEIQKILGIDKDNITSISKESDLLYDYQSVLDKRNGLLKMLEMQSNPDEDFIYLNSIFDNIKEESESNDPPGFYMPDMVATIIFRT